MRSYVTGWVRRYDGALPSANRLDFCSRSIIVAIALTSKPAASSRWKPMRSASYSFSRVKLICDWIASACPEAMAADVACPADDELERDAAIASARPASIISSAFFCVAIERAMWRCVTCVISCASTAASSDSVCVRRMRPVFTPM